MDASSDGGTPIATGIGASDKQRQLGLLIHRLTQQSESSPDADLLRAAAQVLTSMSKELETHADSGETNYSLVKPSAWLTRETKYKQDLQELRRKLAAQEELHARLSADLAAASSGTLVQKLREDIKALEAANNEHKHARSELAAKLQDLSVRNHALVQSSAAASTAWKEICSGKRLPHLGLEHSTSMRSSGSANGQADSPHISGGGGAGGGVDGGNATIVVEHLSVSGAKAKLAQQQATQAASIITLDRRTSMNIYTGPGSSGGHPGSGPNSRRASNTNTIFGMGSAPVPGVEIPPHGMGDALLFGSPGKGDALHHGVSGLLGSPGKDLHHMSTLQEVSAVAPETSGTGAGHVSDDDTQLLDIDDLLGAPAPAVEPIPVSAAAQGGVQADPFDLLGFDVSFGHVPSAPAAILDSAPRSILDMTGADGQAVLSADAGTQAGVAVGVDASTEVSRAVLADVACQGHGVVAMEDSFTQVEEAITSAEPVVVATAATQYDPLLATANGHEQGSQTSVPEVHHTGMQVEALEVPLSPVGLDASTQATPLGADAGVQAGAWTSTNAFTEPASMHAADAATQASVSAENADAATETEAPVVLGADAGVQAGGTDLADAGIGTEGVVMAEASTQSLDVADSLDEKAAEELIRYAESEKMLKQQVTHAEAALANARSEATTAAATVATLEAELQQSADELKAAREAHTLAQTEVAALQCEVTRLKTEVEQVTVLQMEVARLQGEAQEVGALKSEVARLQAHAEQVGALQGEVTRLQGEVEQVGDLQTEVTRLQGTMEAEQQVAVLRQVEAGASASAKAEELKAKMTALEELVSKQSTEVEEARAAAVRTARLLVVAQDELSAAREALNKATADLEASHDRQEQLQLEIQAYEHTMAGLKLAVEEADVEKNRKEQQNLELAERLAFLTEFVSVKAKNPKNATMDYATWLKKRPKDKPIEPVALETSGSSGLQPPTA